MPARSAFHVLAHAGAALLLSAGSAVACAICLSAVQITPGQRLESADLAVLAATKDGQWRVLVRLKGSDPLDAVALSAEFPPAGAISEDHPELLMREGLGHRWSSMGRFDLAQADWLLAFARSRPPEALGPFSTAAYRMTAWRERLALVATRLECGDPRAEDLAHGELARAPYAAMRSLGKSLEASALQEWIGNEDIGSRRAAYILLLGAAGDDTTTVWIDERLETSGRTGDTTDLAALIAADLELRGPARLGWLEERYLLNAASSVAEIEAALKALSVHGNADAAIPRARVVKAYRRFALDRPAMAGFVAADLERWKEWGATAEFVALLKAGAITDPAGELAATSYIRNSPDKQAISRLELLND
ncbi:hypothetical protein [Methyloceanibacter sp.]|uniref:hypothetical protein n=1 Tax=Methyloceanibacter sp. TaxID=1965321 RepID=UPI002BAD6CD6|nr:hypothetical protein [Methyloceanibacter sp.]HML93039.1 hypothetical protein [Methyloceanibacter sp.]